MKEVTKKIIRSFKLYNIDFMGYFFKDENASYHHLIVKKENDGASDFQMQLCPAGICSHKYAVKKRGINPPSQYPHGIRFLHCCIHGKPPDEKQCRLFPEVHLRQNA